MKQIDKDWCLRMAKLETGSEIGAGLLARDPILQTRLPFEIAAGDGALIARAMRAYRPETSEEEGIVNFFID